jgi:uncharacterized protein (DUF1330 family)
MPAYGIFIRERTRDQVELDVYSAMVAASLEGRTLKIHAAYGAYEALEGPEPEGVVLVEFPSMAEAKAWYESPEYRAAREHRFKGADYRAILFEGLSG